MTRTLRAIGLLAAVSLVVLRLHPNFLSRKLISDINLKGLCYDSQSDDPALRSPRAFGSQAGADNPIIDIDFRMKPYAVSNWNNVFQTAAGEAGMRMELSEPHSAGLLIGSLGSGVACGFPIRSDIEIGRWHHVHIRLAADKTLQLYWDGILALDVQEDRFHCEVSDLAVGTGFSQTRPFNGAIENFHFRLWNERDLTGKIIPVLTVICWLILSLTIMALAWRRDVLRVPLDHARQLRTVLAVIGFNCLIGLAWFYLAQTHRLQYAEVKAGHWDFPMFDSRSSDPSLRLIHTRSDLTPSDSTDVSVRFRVFVYALHGIQNIFQMGPNNDGLRGEVSPTGLLSVVVSADFPLSHDLPTLVRGFTLERQIQPGQWYDIRIAIAHSEVVRAWINGRALYDEPMPRLNLSFSQIAVGTGFNQTRPLDGVVRDFHIDYRFSRQASPAWVSWRNRGTLRCLMLVLGIGLALLLIAQIHSWDWLRIPFRPRYLVHPLLWAIFPILFLVAANLNQGTYHMSMVSVGRTALLSIGVTLVLYLLLMGESADGRLGGLLTSLYVVFFYSAGRLWELVGQGRLFDNSFAFVATALLLLAVVLGSVIFFTAEAQETMVRFSNWTAALLIAFSLLPMARHAGSASFSKELANSPMPREAAGLPKRDIYYLILDAYGGTTALHDYMGFDNTKFLDNLRHQGFYIVDHATSNYRTTSLSIPSSMNFDTLHGTSIDSLAPLMIHSAVTRFLKAQGYKIIWINPFHVIIDENPEADAEFDEDSSPPWLDVLLKTTLLFDQPEQTGEPDRRKIHFFFSKLAEVRSIPGPKFVFAHVLCPHHAYVVDPQGNLVPPAEQSDIVHDGAGVINKKGYLGQVQFLNRELETLVAGLIRSSRTAPIIILQGDHGPELYKNVAITEGREFPWVDYHRARMSNLNALYFPDGGAARLYDTMTPINTFRILFNYYFGASYPLLPDRNYYSPDMDLFRFRDITEIVKSTQKS